MSERSGIGRSDACLPKSSKGSDVPSSVSSGVPSLLSFFFDEATNGPSSSSKSPSSPANESLTLPLSFFFFLTLRSSSLRAPPPQDSSVAACKRTAGVCVCVFALTHLIWTAPAASLRACSSIFSRVSLKSDSCTRPYVDFLSSSWTSSILLVKRSEPVRFRLAVKSSFWASNASCAHGAGGRVSCRVSGR